MNYRGMNIRDLGIMAYEDALKIQLDLADKRIKEEIPDTLIMVEHFPVVTLGRLADEGSILDRSYFDKKKIPLIPAGRGGKITYHSPGQLVLYPIIDLKDKKKDIAFYIDFLEETVRRSLLRLDVPAERDNDRRGVWAGGKKIAFIGIAVRRWITFHGVSVNINNDLGAFSKMYPCGEDDIRVTSVKEWLGRETDMTAAREVFADQFMKIGTDPIFQNKK